MPEDIPSKALRLLGEEQRRVTSGWRIDVYLKRRPDLGASLRRDEKRLPRLIERMIKRHQLAPIEGVRGVYTVEVPYARNVPYSDEQVVQEANPYAVFSHLTALAHHSLTTEIPRKIYATHYKGSPWKKRLPLGTTPEDWIDGWRVSTARPDAVGRTSIQWRQCKAEWDFGHMVAFSQGQPVYVTDVERTLLDSLRDPTASSGFTNILRAWRRASEGLDIPRLIGYTQHFGIDVLKARVGYLLEALELNHPELDQWAASMPRGGSMRLVPGREFASRYSERWNLSLNVPADAMAALEKE